MVAETSQRSFEAKRNPSVLLLLHARTRDLERVFSRVDQMNPRKIYISGDGARSRVSGEVQNVEEVWKIVEEFPWSRPILTQRAVTNLGSLKAVTNGVTWFLEQERQGLIVEDDVLIDPRGLPLVKAMLDVQSRNANVGSISMFNPVPQRKLSEPHASYRFSNLFSGWFWGTTYERWAQRVVDLENWREIITQDRLEDVGGSRFAKTWEAQLDKMSKSDFGSWEWRWLVTHWARDWTSLFANASYSSHLGFGEGASSFSHRPSWYRESTSSFDGLIKDPVHGKVDRQADSWMAAQYFGHTRWKTMKRSISRSLPRSYLLWLRLNKR